MTFRMIGTTRRAHTLTAITLAATAAAAALIVGQTGVIGAEDDSKRSTAFAVAGDGSLPTKRPALGQAREPLSTDETGYAVRIAAADASIPPGASNVRGEGGPQVLYTDIPDSDVDASGRQALIVLYDYTGDRVYHQLVDLKAGAVIRSKSATGLQPPMAADEADEAIAIAVTAADQPRFIADFEKAEGVPLVSPEQVAYIAGSWTYDATTVGGKECGADRCAQLQVSTAAGAYLNTTDFVVNLSTKKLVALERR